MHGCMHGLHLPLDARPQDCKVGWPVLCGDAEPLHVDGVKAVASANELLRVDARGDARDDARLASFVGR